MVDADNLTALVELFQFPSNGKVYSKDYYFHAYTVVEWVSIPFKRESVFKETPF